MKKLVLVLVVVLFAGFASAQKDVINLKDGTVIKCKIVSVDTLSKSISYLSKDLNEKFSIELSKVGSYEMDGEINKGMPVKEKPAPVAPLTEDQLYSQPDARNKAAGLNFIKFADQAQTGIFMMMVGTAISTLPWILSSDDTSDASATENKQKTVAYIGMGVSLIGFIVHISSFSKARKAGEIMQINENLSVNVTDCGLGLVIPIK